MQLLRDVIGDRLIGSFRADIACIYLAVGAGVELPLVADQDIDRPFKHGWRAEHVIEPDVEIVRRRRHALLGHRPHGLFRDRRRVLEIQLVECRRHGIAGSLSGKLPLFFACRFP